MGPLCCKYGWMILTLFLVVSTEDVIPAGCLCLQSFLLQAKMQQVQTEAEAMEQRLRACLSQLEEQVWQHHQQGQINPGKSCRERCQVLQRLQSWLIANSCMGHVPMMPPKTLQPKLGVLVDFSPPDSERQCFLQHEVQMAKLRAEHGVRLEQTVGLLERSVADARAETASLQELLDRVIIPFRGTQGT